MPLLASSVPWTVDRLAIIEVKTAIAKEPKALRIQLLMEDAWPDISRGICSML
ncbi:hypothetical protein D3C71_1971370 [compost metagenome]